MRIKFPTVIGSIFENSKGSPPVRTRILQHGIEKVFYITLRRNEYNMKMAKCNIEKFLLRQSFTTGTVTG